MLAVGVVLVRGGVVLLEGAFSGFRCARAFPAVGWRFGQWFGLLGSNHFVGSGSLAQGWSVLTRGGLLVWGFVGWESCLARGAVFLLRGRLAGSGGRLARGGLFGWR